MYSSGQGFAKILRAVLEATGIDQRPGRADPIISRCQRYREGRYSSTLQGFPVASAYCLSVEKTRLRSPVEFWSASEKERIGSATCAFANDKRDDVVLIHVGEDTKPDYPRYVSQNIPREDARTRESSDECGETKRCRHCIANALQSTRMPFILTTA